MVLLLYNGSATNANTIVLQSTSTITFAGGNGSTTGLYNTGAASNTLKISGTTVDFGSATVTNGTSASCYYSNFTIWCSDYRRSKWWHRYIIEFSWQYFNCTRLGLVDLSIRWRLSYNNQLQYWTNSFSNQRRQDLQEQQ